VEQVDEGTERRVYAFWELPLRLSCETGLWSENDRADCRNPASEFHGDWKLHSNDNKVMKEFETGKRLRLDREAYDDVFIVGGRHG